MNCAKTMQAQVDALYSIWELESEQYNAYLQWLPSEMLDDVLYEVLVKRIPLNPQFDDDEFLNVFKSIKGNMYLTIKLAMYCLKNVKINYESIGMMNNLSLRFAAKEFISYTPLDPLVKHMLDVYNKIEDPKFPRDIDIKYINNKWKSFIMTKTTSCDFELTEKQAEEIVNAIINSNPCVNSRRLLYKNF